MKPSISEVITPDAPPAVGPYSQALIVSGSPTALVFVSGQLPIDSSGLLIVSDIKDATRCVFRNIEAILKAAKTEFSHVVKVEIFLRDMGSFAVVNEVYHEFFLGPRYPARQTVEVSRLPRDALLEISCVAIA